MTWNNFQRVISFIIVPTVFDLCGIDNKKTCFLPRRKKKKKTNNEQEKKSDRKKTKFVVEY